MTDDRAAGLDPALYVVATPIGHLEDLSPRARATLTGAACVAAEDTRRAGQLLRHFGIEARLVSLHEHNERARVAETLDRIAGGHPVALVSDAGTPLVSDPGRRLVQAAHEAGHRVVPIPGPSAVMAALSAAGLVADRFVFEGFLPSKGGARRKRLAALAAEPRTLVLFEAPHRVAATLTDLAEAWGESRQGVLCRELTKRFETIRSGSLVALRDWVATDSNQERGEIVLVIEGAPARDEVLDEQTERTMAVLLETHGASEAARLGARITGLPKNLLYNWAVGKHE